MGKKKYELQANGYVRWIAKEMEFGENYQKSIKCIWMFYLNKNIHLYCLCMNSSTNLF